MAAPSLLLLRSAAKNPKLPLIYKNLGIPSGKNKYLQVVLKLVLQVLPMKLSISKSPQKIIMNFQGYPVPFSLNGKKLGFKLMSKF